MLVLVGLLLGGLLVQPASAVRIDADQVVVPVVVHLPGYGGTQWRSDVWVENVYGDSSEVTLTYYPVEGGTLTVTRQVEVDRGIYLHDIVLETFGLSNSKGMLIVSGPSTHIEVRARVYNMGNACGEFGQAIPGLPLDRLNWLGLLSGLTTSEGTRLSLGIANPTDMTFSVTVQVSDSVTGEDLAFKTIDLAPHQLVQLDKLAELWNLPARDMVKIYVETLSDGAFFYTYASVVRNDTGDGTFVFGTTVGVGPL